MQKSAAAQHDWLSQQIASSLFESKSSTGIGLDNDCDIDPVVQSYNMHIITKQLMAESNAPRDNEPNSQFTNALSRLLTSREDTKAHMYISLAEYYGATRNTATITLEDVTERKPAAIAVLIESILQQCRLSAAIIAGQHQGASIYAIASIMSPLDWLMIVSCFEIRAGLVSAINCMHKWQQLTFLDCQEFVRMQEEINMSYNYWASILATIGLENQANKHNQAELDFASYLHNIEFTLADDCLQGHLLLGATETSVDDKLRCTVKQIPDDIYKNVLRTKTGNMVEKRVIEFRFEPLDYPETWLGLVMQSHGFITVRYLVPEDDDDDSDDDNVSSKKKDKQQQLQAAFSSKTFPLSKMALHILYTREHIFITPVGDLPHSRVNLKAIWKPLMQQPKLNNPPPPPPSKSASRVAPKATQQDLLFPPSNNNNPTQKGEMGKDSAVFGFDGEEIDRALALSLVDSQIDQDQRSSPSNNSKKNKDLQEVKESKEEGGGGIDPTQLSILKSKPVAILPPGVTAGRSSPLIDKARELSSMSSSSSRGDKSSSKTVENDRKRKRSAFPQASDEEADEFATAYDQGDRMSDDEHDGYGDDHREKKLIKGNKGRDFKKSRPSRPPSPKRQKRRSRSPRGRLDQKDKSKGKDQKPREIPLDEEEAACMEDADSLDGSEDDNDNDNDRHSKSLIKRGLKPSRVVLEQSRPRDGQHKLAFDAAPVKSGKGGSPDVDRYIAKKRAEQEKRQSQSKPKRKSSNNNDEDDEDEDDDEYDNEEDDEVDNSKFEGFIVPDKGGKKQVNFSDGGDEAGDGGDDTFEMKLKEAMFYFHVDETYHIPVSNLSLAFRTLLVLSQVRNGVIHFPSANEPDGLSFADMQVEWETLVAEELPSFFCKYFGFIELPPKPTQSEPQTTAAATTTTTSLSQWPQPMRQIIEFFVALTALKGELEPPRFWVNVADFGKGMPIGSLVSEYHASLMINYFMKHVDCLKDGERVVLFNIKNIWIRSVSKPTHELVGAISNNSHLMRFIKLMSKTEFMPVQ